MRVVLAATPTDPEAGLRRAASGYRSAVFAFAGWAVFGILVVIVLVAFAISALVNRAEPGTGVSKQLKTDVPRVRTSLGRSGHGSSAPDDATKAELYEQAKEAGIAGRSTMSKDELKAALDDETS